MGSLKQLIHCRIEDISFRIYSDDEIQNLSVLHITNEESLNALGHYTDNGIYDKRLGPMSNSDDCCKTCFCFYFNCSGHCGHIDLPLPVFNPFFREVIRNLLSRICPSCYRFRVRASRGIQFVYECMMACCGFAHQALEISSLVANFMMNTKEALEDNGNKNIVQEAETVSTVVSLEKMLKKYFNKLKEQEDSCSRTFTSNSQAVYELIQRKFLDDTRPLSSSVCMYCKTPYLKLKFDNSQIAIIKSSSKKRAKYSSGSIAASDQAFLTPKQAQEMIRKCYEQDGFVIKHLFPFLGSSKLPHPTDLFFMNKLIVIPPRYRPLTPLQNSISENEISVMYKSVIRISNCLRFMVKCKDDEMSSLPEHVRFLLSELSGSTLIEKSQLLWVKLQSLVDNILDADINPNSRVSSRGVRQIVEKKFGLFRRNLMGKRVNYSARSVAAPDPLLAVDEVGVPLDFALKLSYPVPVTPWNVSVLRKLVERGPLNYPGAVMVEDEEGKKVLLKPHDVNQRIAIAKSLLTPIESCARKVNTGKIVYRQLQSGDYVLMNRQPSLHKPSIQAHRARVMKDRVLRMPYANCKAYNADFDGDELNLHFPQNEMARSESKFIMNTFNQYLSHKDGSPLAGLIQDTVVAGVMLTVRGRFFIREDYYQLVFTSLDHLRIRQIQLLPPSIVKPSQLWSGKQIISTILMNLIPRSKSKPSLTCKTSSKADFLMDCHNEDYRSIGGNYVAASLTDAEFVMSEGELLRGVIDKSAIGSTRFGLVHLFYELYGGALASNLLTSVNKLCVAYLQWMGHTISLKEFVTGGSIARRRRKALAKLIKKCEPEVATRLGVEEEALCGHVRRLHLKQDEKGLSSVDAAYTAVLGPSTSAITKTNEGGLLFNGLRNRMRIMVDTGAKGSKVNMNQMASLFGSVALDGKRMPMSATGKTLPAFRPYDCDPRAGGFISSRFVTGMDPRSYFFLCIVGRDSLQHTALKTANSGYMQRCLIKHLEGIKVEYDRTVRNSDGLVLQFGYGEDGLDVSKVPFLSTLDSMDILVKNQNMLLDHSEMLGNRFPSIAGLDKSVYGKYEKSKKANDCAFRLRRSGFLSFCADMAATTDEEEMVGTYEPVASRSGNAMRLCSLWNRLEDRLKKKYLKVDGKVKLVKSGGIRSLSGGEALSEALEELVDRYFDEMCTGESKNKKRSFSKEQVASIFSAKASRSYVEPGEAVGALCAQAIGEPLTQMTLNTFHFAGRDELNITLGVPRMIEILRTAPQSIKTPIMEVPFKALVSRAQADKLKIQLTPVPLSQVIHKVSVTECLNDHSFALNRLAELHFELLPRSEYKSTFCVKPRVVLSFLETHFLKSLIREIKASIKKANLYATSLQSSAASAGNADDEEGDAEETGVGTSSPSAFGAFRNKELGDDEVSSDEEERDSDRAVDVDVGSVLRSDKAKEKDYSEDEVEEADIEDQVFAKEGEPTRNDDEDDQRFNREKEEDFMSADLSVASESLLRSAPSSSQHSDLEHVRRRESSVKSLDSFIFDYQFDGRKNLWCKVTLVLPIAEGRYDLSSIVRKVVENSVVYSVPGIKKVVVEQKNDTLFLRTEGVNIIRMYPFESLLDLNRIYTNNIYLMAKRYGVEAAQRSIIREIREVQSAYDIKVDFRHLTLLADYFTREGVYKACSRFALDTCASPIQKMSYETCFQFMRKSLLQGISDNMTSPSAQVMVGQPVKIGTNHSMQILYKLSL